jgi:hypothetical protein
MPSRTFRRSAIGLHATTFLVRQMERADEHVLKRRRLGTLGPRGLLRTGVRDAPVALPKDTHERRGAPVLNARSPVGHAVAAVDPCEITGTDSPDGAARARPGSRRGPRGRDARDRGTTLSGLLRS